MKFLIITCFLCVGVTASNENNVNPTRKLGCVHDYRLCRAHGGLCINDGLFGVCYGYEGGMVWFYHPTYEQSREAGVLVNNLLSSGVNLSDDYSQCMLRSAVSAYRRGAHIIDYHLDDCNILWSTTASTPDLEIELASLAIRMKAEKAITDATILYPSSRQHLTTVSTARTSSPTYGAIQRTPGYFNPVSPHHHSETIQPFLPTVERVFKSSGLVVYVVCGIIAVLAVVAGVIVLLCCCKMCNNRDPQNSKNVELSALPSFSRITSLGQAPVKQPCPWFQEPVHFYIDSITATNILAYMEEHLKNEHLLSEEWNKLCSYQPCLTPSPVARDKANASKNCYSDESLLPYEHTRVRLRASFSTNASDYINASRLTDSDPHSITHIVTQHPLRNTVADFWQMVWEQKCTVIVNLTSNDENAECYWPANESEPAVYREFEVKMIREYRWCNEFITRNFIVINNRTDDEPLSVAQFHFIAWSDNSPPTSPQMLLDFRRKVIKSFHGQKNPVVVHCSDGIGRSGTYCLIDTVLSRLSKGAKEINIPATLEHLRDQRPKLVLTKEQYQFAFSAIVNELRAFKRG